MPRHCSFCGKSETDVARLIAGGGRQPSGQLPLVLICDRCVELCAAIISREERQSDALVWSLFTDDGEYFEWAAFSQSNGSMFVVVRHRGGTSSIGGVLGPGESASTEKAREILKTLRDRS